MANNYADADFEECRNNALKKKQKYMSFQDGNKCRTGDAYDTHGKTDVDAACLTCKSFTGTDKHVVRSD
jgi:hypothetical protein